MSGWAEWLAPTGISVGVYTCAQTCGMLAQSKATDGTIRGGVGKITIVCYLFSLSAYLTVMAGGWLFWSAQLSSDGQPTSEFAKLGFLVAGESIGFMRELVFIAALMSIVIVPQLVNYFVAGLFGSAGGTKFGAWCLRFVFWAVLKGLAVAGGVSVGWGLMATFLHWPRAYDSSPSQLLGMGLSQIAASVLATTMAGPLEDRSLALLRSKMSPIVGPLMPIHRWLTRHRVPENEKAIPSVS